jgi:ribosome biogenesis GTPase
MERRGMDREMAAIRAMGPEAVDVLAASLRDGDPAGGQPSGDGPRRITVEAVLPRRTSFVRAGAAHGVALGQVLAANVDSVIIAEGLWPEPDLGRIERLLALAWESGAQPVVVLTKADLASDAAQLRDDVAANAPGVDVSAVSALTGAGLAALAPYVSAGRTVALLGASGTGKSTLLNTLAGEEVMATQAMRSDHKGRHTTVHRELVRLPSGGMVIDTPGLRSVGLWDAADALDRVFADIDELALSCRFGDCQHLSEPGCAVVAAVENGTLSYRRLQSWRKLQREAAWIASRSDARLRQERLAQWKRIHRDIRRNGQIRR